MTDPTDEPTISMPVLRDAQGNPLSSALGTPVVPSAIEGDELLRILVRCLGDIQHIEAEAVLEQAFAVRDELRRSGCVVVRP